MEAKYFVFWYFWLVGVAAHLYLLWRILDLQKPSKYCIHTVPKQVVKSSNNPSPAKKITCACCDDEQWVEADSEAYLCSKCDTVGNGLGGH